MDLQPTSPLRAHPIGARAITVPANLLKPPDKSQHPPFKSNLDGALWWFAFGYKVMPMVPGEKRPAVKKFDWLDKLTEAAIREHWAKHPDHEVGAILDLHQLVLDADTPEALETLVRLEQEFHVTPSLIVRTRRGEHHHYRTLPDTFTKSDSHSTAEHPERLDVRAVPSSILLTPSTNKSVVRLDAKDVAGMTAVGQDFIDAVFRHNGRPEPRPAPEWSDDDDLERFTGEISTEVLAKLLKEFDPDLGYQDWLNVLMAIFHGTGGSKAGLDLADAWSKKGTSYKDRADIETKWKSFRRDVANPITVGTLIALAKQAGADVASILQEDFEPCDYEIIEPSTPEPAPEPATTASPFLKHSLIGQSARFQELAQPAEPLLGGVCLKGEATLWYAKPNAGKTLLCLHLLIEAAEAGRIVPGNVFYINADDSSSGLAEKMTLLDEIGAHTLVPGHKGFKAANLEKLLNEAARDKTARGTLIVLDTAKKFVDLMNKREASTFATACRRYVSAGGTILALAHTNKNRGEDGKLIPAGTSDLLDDSDAAYVIDALPIGGEPGEKLIQFERVKGRGGGVKAATYSYADEDGLSYAQRLASVKAIDPDQIDEFRRVEEQRTDAEMIAAVTTCINEGVNSKMKLSKAVAEQIGISRRAAMQVIDRYTGADPDQHRWSFSRGARGAMIYRLLGVPDNEADQAA